MTRILDEFIAVTGRRRKHVFTAGFRLRTTLLRDGTIVQVSNEGWFVGGVPSGHYPAGGLQQPGQPPVEPNTQSKGS